jgi:hypothetical protein
MLRGQASTALLAAPVLCAAPSVPHSDSQTNAVDNFGGHGSELWMVFFLHFFFLFFTGRSGFYPELRFMVELLIMLA